MYHDLHWQLIVLFVGRNINIVGTINAGQERWYTTIESGRGARNREPMYIGHVIDQHYQSLEPT